MSLVRIGRLRSGAVVFDYVEGGHVAQHPEVLPFLAEGFRKIDAEEREVIEEEIDLGRILGYTRCVTTSPKDEIIFAQRKNARV